MNSWITRSYMLRWYHDAMVKALSVLNYLHLCHHVMQFFNQILTRLDELLKWAYRTSCQFILLFSWFNFMNLYRLGIKNQNDNFFYLSLNHQVCISRYKSWTFPASAKNCPWSFPCICRNLRYLSDSTSSFDWWLRCRKMPCIGHLQSASLTRYRIIVMTIYWSNCMHQKGLICIYIVHVLTLTDTKRRGDNLDEIRQLSSLCLFNVVATFMSMLSDFYILKKKNWYFYWVTISGYQHGINNNIKPRHGAHQTCNSVYRCNGIICTFDT